MQRQLPESVERSASLSAAQVGGQRISLPCPAHVGQVDPLAILIMLAGLVAEPVLLVTHARIGSAVQRGHQPDRPAGRSREPHPLWWPREFEKAGAADADRVA